MATTTNKEIHTTLPLYKLTKTIEEENQWFQECRKHKSYYITITKKRKYYKISWDHISIDTSIITESKRLDPDKEHIANCILNIFNAHTQHLVQHTAPAYDYSILRGSFINIPESVVFDLAKNIACYFQSIVAKYY